MDVTAFLRMLQDYYEKLSEMEISIGKNTPLADNNPMRRAAVLQAQNSLKTAQFGLIALKNTFN